MTPTRLDADIVVVGGGPAGATAADDLARAGRSVVLLDRAGRIKPCGGAIPPRLVRDFDIPADLIVARISAARMVAPSARTVDMPITDDGYVGMVDRDVFDEWLRARAASHGAERRTGTFERILHDEDGTTVVEYSTKDGETARLRTRCVIGADGARSAVARQAIGDWDRSNFVFAYHEVVQRPEHPPAGYDDARCDVIYRGELSPDFYAWVFPHGSQLSIGTGSANKGFSLRSAVGALRREIGLEDAVTVRCEGAPLPMKPLPRWDNGRDVLLVGDAAGVVAPSSGEGIYYAMACARIGSQAVQKFLATGDARQLAAARRMFLKEHGRVFWVLGLMQRFWYRDDKRRERFVKMCRDRDVQKLTFDAYMNKRLVRAKPMAHLKIFFKDVAHLLGLARV